MRPILLRVGLFLCLAAMPGAARATDYPTKPVHVILGFTAGSGIDIMARTVGQHFAEATGQQFVIENRPGAGSNLATGMVAKAAPDGYTILLATVANAINATVYRNLPFDFLRDFSPVILTGSASNVLVVNPSSPARTMQELIDLAKARPGKLTFGSSGSGTLPHMAGELFRRRAGIDVIHVPYKGGPQATTDLVSGQIDYLFAITSTALPHIESGRLRVLAVTSKERTPQLPNVPTISESGLPGFEAVTWFGFVVPAGTPREIVDRLNAEIGKVLSKPEVKKQLAAQGIDVAGGTPEQLGGYMREEFAKWGSLVKDAAVTVD